MALLRRLNSLRIDAETINLVTRHIEAQLSEITEQLKNQTADK